MPDHTPNESPAVSRLEAVLAEIIQAQEQGQAIDLQRYADSFPELAGPLRDYIQDRELFARLARRLAPAAGESARDVLGAAAGLPCSSPLAASERPEPAGTQATLADDEPADPFPGVFRLLRRVGRGAFGSVWLAEDLHLGRQVALKMILPGGPPAEADRRLDRLRDEARLLARLRHPNIVPILSWQEGKDAQGSRTAALVMLFVPGGSLADRVRRDGPLSWPMAARYLADVADGLLAVHAAQLVHRDVKPANILWDPAADEALLTDFGLSVRLSDAVGAAGTPFYMPPEAFDGRGGPAQDVYGLAASLFWLVTGSVPFPAEDPQRLIEQVRRGLPETDPRCAQLPRPLEGLIRAGLAVDPDERLGLADFTVRLRGSLNQLLADSLLLPTATASAGPAAPAPAPTLRLTVSRQDAAGTFTPVATTRPAAERPMRDLRRVPPVPERADVRTGERVRIEVDADQAGYVAVFNIGPTGNLHLLHPERAGGLAAIEPGRPLHVLDIELTPPAGAERIFALWGRSPLPLRLDELAGLATGGAGPAPGPYRATRDLKRLHESVRQLRPEDWQSVVLELNHLPSQ
jgi:tRNA A-37 threonylcarbamoyl transferase component Bud32